MCITIRLIMYLSFPHLKLPCYAQLRLRQCPPWPAAQLAGSARRIQPESYRGHRANHRGTQHTRAPGILSYVSSSYTLLLRRYCRVAEVRCSLPCYPLKPLQGITYGLPFIFLVFNRKGIKRLYDIALCWYKHADELSKSN